MTDVHDQQTRSYNMSQIKAQNTRLESRIRKYLFSKGFRYRKNDKRYPGKPDIVLPKYKTIIFINGCFWHGHDGCKYFKWPKNNEDFWHTKIIMNRKRDEAINQMLANMGFNILTVWECETRNGNFENRMNELIQDILNH